MMQRLPILWFALLGICSTPAPSQAQELRVYTTIRDLSTPAAAKNPDQAPVLVRSLMLFHAGKVYDYIEPAHEVTFFEPAHRRFTVLNLRRQLCSELTQDEIRQFLGLAEDEAHRRLGIETPDASPSTRKSLELVKFQVQPDFTTTFDAGKLQLSLTSPNFEYVVDGFKPPSSDIVEKYLHVADWTAQLNSVLRPQSLLPAPRLQLNEVLRERQILPSTVILRADTDPALHLQARHEWTWTFSKTDRQMIDDWDRHLLDQNLRKLPFRQFQQEMLKTEIARKR
jgi:hypothetical protein